MKVYFVSNRYDGCWYVRCYLPMVANGWDGDKTSPLSPKVSEQKRAEGALNADVIVFQRPDDPKMLEIAQLLQKAGKKIVFDNDDTYIPDSGVPTQIEDIQGKNKLKVMSDALNDFMANADAVTTTTKFLSEEYKKLNENTYVLPNMVDPDDWDTPKRNTNGKVRIGMVGSVASNQNYEPILPLIEKYQNDPRVELVLLGIPKQVKSVDYINKAYQEELKVWNKYNIEWHHFVPQSEYNDKLNDLELDIMLIPRHDSYFNRAKSNIKFLEASMLEIPVIAQGFTDGESPYQGKDGEYMGIVIDNDDWIKTTEELIVNKSLRESMGKKAHKYVVDNYSINVVGNQWYDVFNELIN